MFFFSLVTMFEPKCESMQMGPRGTGREGRERKTTAVSVRAARHSLVLRRVMRGLHCIKTCFNASARVLISMQRGQKGKESSFPCFPRLFITL